MKGKIDISRDTFRKEYHYNKVQMQQGRVQVDADWNEQVDIQNYHDTSCLKDILGQSGTLVNRAGFFIESKETGTGAAKIESLSIGKGHYYVDGIFIENEEDVEISKQQDFPWFKKDGRTRLAPDLKTGFYLAYLDVWERQITALDDPAIRESALGGEADTATRSKVVWQVKLTSIDDALSSADSEGSTDWKLLATDNRPISSDETKIIAVGANKDGRLQVFGIGEDNFVYYTLQDKPNEEVWDKWMPLKADSPDMHFSEIAVGANKDGRLQVFGIEAKEKQVYYTLQDKPNEEVWGKWTLIDADTRGMQFSEIAVSANKDGRLEVFGIRVNVEDKIVYHVTQEKEDDPNIWLHWKLLEKLHDAESRPMQFRHIAVGSNQDGRLGVVGIAVGIGEKDNVVHYLEQPTENERDWTSRWRRSNKKFSRIGVGPNLDGRLEVFGVEAKDKQVYHMATPEKDAPLRDTWRGTWKVLEGPDRFVDIAVGLNHLDGCLGVYGLRNDGIITHIVQPEPNVGDWGVSKWKSLNESSTFNKIAVLEPQKGQLEVIAVSIKDNFVYHLKKSIREVDCSLPIPSWDDMIKPSIVTLQARSKKGRKEEDRCMVPPSGGGYRGLENQLYRVEIHDSGEADNGATFKYSRDNGTVVTKIKDISGEKISVGNSGRDKLLGFETGQWVEITDDYRELYGLPGTMVKLKGDITEYKLTVDLSSIEGDEITSENFPQEFNPKVRRWDSKDGIAKVRIPAENDGFLALEDGIQIKFGKKGTYLTGDYWLIPARTNNGEIEWPRRGDDPEPILRKGIEHHYCRLSIIEYTSETIRIKKDCRRFFSPLTDTSAVVLVASTTTGKIVLGLKFGAAEEEIKKNIISLPFNHGLRDITSPPSIILAIENREEGDKEGTYLGTGVVYKKKSGVDENTYRLSPVDVNLETFKIYAENLDDAGTYIEPNIRFWAIPAKEIESQEQKIR